MTVRVQVLKVHELQSASTGKAKQDVLISNITGKGSLTLWETDINILKGEKSYQLNRLLIRVFMGKYHLSLPTMGSTIDEISDVENSSDNSDSENEERLI